MHPNTVFHTQSWEENLAFVARRAFGSLIVNGAEGPLVSHVPFLIDQDRIWLHLVRSNPIARDLSAEKPACLAVTGPDSYISPDWYGVPDQVPTWNYIAVHIRGALERRPQEELRGVIDRQSAFFEQQLSPKTPWRSEKMSPGIMDKMMKAIVPCCLTIAQVDGTWKLNQNKPASARLAAADAVETSGIGTGLPELAELMRTVAQQK